MGYVSHLTCSLAMQDPHLDVHGMSQRPAWHGMAKISASQMVPKVWHLFFGSPDQGSVLIYTATWLLSILISDDPQRKSTVKSP